MKRILFKSLAVATIAGLPFGRALRAADKRESPLAMPVSLQALHLACSGLIGGEFGCIPAHSLIAPHRFISSSQTRKSWFGRVKYLPRP
jgi:hypothetical protein